MRRRAGLALGGQHGRHRHHAGKPHDGVFRRLAHGLEPVSAFRVDLDGEDHVAVLDREARDHAEVDDIGVAVGIVDALERLEDFLVTDLGHGDVRRLSQPSKKWP